jgi:chaperone required for assembly of F1-ATPase
MISSELNQEAVKYLYRAIIRYLDGDKILFKAYADKATELYEKGNRLYVPISEIARIKHW